MDKKIKVKFETAAKACADIRLGCPICPFKKEKNKNKYICIKVRDFVVGKNL